MNLTHQINQKVQLSQAEHKHERHEDRKVIRAIQNTQVLEH